MKLIELGGQKGAGLFALVDDSALELVTPYKWSLAHGYAYSSRVGFMHRFLTNAPKDKFVDHADKNRLNNQRANLRHCDRSLNAANNHSSRTNKSGYKGVYWLEPNQKWRAYIRVNGRAVHLGLFDTAHEAAVAYNAAASVAFGSFASLNSVLTSA
jgi:AP2 domain/HNH endonuclease